MPATEKKAQYFEKVGTLFEEYDKLFVVNADNVGSSQFQQIRKALRGKAVILMGKNTCIRKAMRSRLEKIPQIEKLLPLVKYNVGFVFTHGDFAEIRDIISQFQVGAPARTGAVAPIDVFVPPGPTGMEPTQTSFFQALQIATKINKGQIEIINEVKLINAGEKVSASQAALLQKLNIKPFFYGLTLLHIYENGSIFEPKVLDITQADILKTFSQGVANVAALSLAIGIPTLASVPHSIINGYKNVLAIALASDYSFPLADKVKEILKNPGAFAAAAPAAAAPAAAAAAAPAKEEKKEESEESDGDMGFGLFD